MRSRRESGETHQQQVMYTEEARRGARGRSSQAERRCPAPHHQAVKSAEDLTIPRMEVSTGRGKNRLSQPVGGANHTGVGSEWQAGVCTNTDKGKHKTRAERECVILGLFAICHSVLSLLKNLRQERLGLNGDGNHPSGRRKREKRRGVSQRQRCITSLCKLATKEETLQSEAYAENQGGSRGTRKTAAHSKKDGTLTRQADTWEQKGTLANWTESAGWECCRTVKGPDREPCWADAGGIWRTQGNYMQF